MIQNLNNFIEHFNDHLNKALDNVSESFVKDAMLYALSSEGKRLRPYLVYCLSNKQINDPVLLQVCSTIEMIHTYSLVHDDLPAMDNDDYRRGRLTTHKVFDEATAILAGDALLTYAFSVISKLDLKSDDIVELIQVIADASGADGMILGQAQDMINDAKSDFSVDELYRLYTNKTGKLFSAALKMGNILANKPVRQSDLEKIGYKLGIVFQIQDDYLESTSSFDVLGKSVLSDINNQKNTVVLKLGIEKSKELINNLYDELNHDIINLSQNYPNLIGIVNWMKDRNK
jgi:geranylgeranyl diphosphate synthase, type II